jgi:hypothetical protein
MLKPLALTYLLAVVALTGCANQRYEWNLAHQHLSPKVQKMSLADVRSITRLVSEHCGAPIICIRYTGSTGPLYADEIWVVAGNSTTMENSQNALFRLKKQSGAWRIIEGGYGLSTSLIICGDG